MPCSNRMAMSMPTFGAKSTGGRGDGKPDDPDGEDPPAAEPVAERAAQQQERCQGEEVAGHDPLQGGHADMEVPADRRQGDSDDGRVDGSDARTHDGSGDDPAARRGAVSKTPANSGRGLRCLAQPSKWKPGTVMALGDRCHKARSCS